MTKISQFERFLAPTGRMLMGVFFILAGSGKLVSLPATTALITSIGLPMGSILALLAALIEIIAGFMLLTGFKGKCAALMLAVFVLVVTFPFHGPRLWADDPIQQIMFMKNLAIIGALLFMAAHINRVADIVDHENGTQKQPTPTL